MMLRIKILFPTLSLYFPPILSFFGAGLSFFAAGAQKLNKNDKITLANLETNIRYLADPKLEGRRMGTPGDKAASDYIISELSNAGLRPKGDNNGWVQDFTIDQGREISDDSWFSVNDQPLVRFKEYFPLDFSATGQVSGSPAIALQERGVPWFQDVKELLETSPGHLRPDLAAAIRARAAACAKKGATALILYNSSRLPDHLAFDPRDKPETAVIPIIYVTAAAKRKYLKDESASVDIRIKVGFTESLRTGHNVVAWLDNGAPSTVIIGAHYDGLGHGEDSSAVCLGPGAAHSAPGTAASVALPTGVPAANALVYFGADDNASGVAGMIELARLLAASKLRNNNYLFIAFSGGELESAGSAWFIQHPATDLKKVNYMINMDMIGRLNDTTHTLTIGGYGSSPLWGPVCNAIRDKKFLSLHYVGNGTQHGDHAAFYRATIPVLVFTTGLSADYHQPGDDAGKINYPGELQVLKFIYSVVEGVNSRGRVTFTPAADSQSLTGTP
jgi:aminopeptidase YwaD